MAQPPLSCCWRPGALRPFESVASLGAKYCYLNKIRFIDFWEMLSEFLPRGADVPDGASFLDEPGFNMSKFAHYLGEPLSVVTTLALRKINSGSYLKAVSGSATHDFNLGTFRFCLACLANGYHSSLHQLQWMDKCFIHGVPLQSNHRASSTNLRLALRLIQPLSLRWFNPEKIYLATDETWSAAKSPIWDSGDHKLIRKAALKVISRLRTAERRLAGTQAHPLSLIGDSIGGRLIMAMNAVGISTQHLSGLMNSRNLKLKQTRHLICSREEAEAILELDSHDIALLMHSRQVMCVISGLQTQWKIALDRLESQLTTGHAYCLKLLYESTFCGEKIRLGNTNQFVKAPFNRALFQSVPCDRIVTLNFLQNLLDIEEDNPFSRISLTELSWYKNHWPLLLTLGLTGYVSGYMHRNDHRLFLDNNLYLKFQDADGEERRKCQLFAPLGILADILDEMILAHVWSWNWALFHMERKASHPTSGVYYPERFLRDETHALQPVFSLRETPSGLAMKVGTFIPFKSPPWRTCMGDQQEHRLEVTEIYHFLLDRLHEQINRGMSKITLNDSIVKWLRETNGHEFLNAKEK